MSAAAARAAELELDQERAGERDRATAPSSGSRAAADISAAVAELDKEHAGELDRGGDRRRRGADRAGLGPCRARHHQRGAEREVPYRACGVVGGDLKFELGRGAAVERRSAATSPVIGPAAHVISAA